MAKKRSPSKALAADKAKKAAEQAKSVEGVIERLTKRLSDLDAQFKLIKDRSEQAQAILDQSTDQLKMLAGARNEVRLTLKDLGGEDPVLGVPNAPADEPEAAPDGKPEGEGEGEDEAEATEED